LSALAQKQRGGRREKGKKSSGYVLAPGPIGCAQ
jgi:hypothetical protein